MIIVFPLAVGAARRKEVGRSAKGYILGKEATDAHIG